MVAYYVSTGRWGSDPYLAAKLNKGRKALNLTGLFSDVATVPIGADELHKAYSRTTEAASAEFVFADKTLLPEIDGISEAYIGVVPISEFWPIIEDERHAIRKSLFIENVRDYLDSNPVNDRIKETLNSQERANFCPQQWGDHRH